MRLTLSAKALGLTLLIALAGLLLMVSILPGVLRQNRLAELEKTLAGKAYLIRHSYASLLLREASVQELQQRTRWIGYGVQTQIHLLDLEGNLLAGSSPHPSRVTDPEQLSAIQRAFGLDEEGHPGYYRLLTPERIMLFMPLVRRDENSIALQVTSSLNPLERSVWRITGLALLLVLVLSALTLLSLHIWVSSMAGPLRSMTRMSRRIAEGDLPQMVRRLGTDEVGDLGRAFNHMAVSLDARINQLREAETTMRTAFAHMADGVAVLDSGGRVLLLNRVAEETFGMTAERARGRTLLDVSLHKELDGLVFQALRSRIQGSGEIQLRRPSTHILRVYVTPVPADEDSSLGAVLVFQDLTEIRRLENVRRDFVTNASHELKTPLATINVMVDTLKKGMEDDPETARRFLQTIGTEVRRLGALVDDLLDLSKIESETLRFEFEVIALEPVLRSLVNTHRPAAEQRSQTLKAQLTGDTLIWADPNAIIRIAGNLIENALKYTRDGGEIEVSCGSHGREAFFTVSDNGVGIPESEQSRIFERFYRVDKGRSRASGGTGLGLSIVKHLVEVHNGRIEVESAPGRGSRFTVRLPAILEEDWREDTPYTQDEEIPALPYHPS